MTIRAPSLIVIGMTRRSFPFLFFGLLVIAVLARSLILWAIWLVVLVGYVVSVVIHPRTRCTHCSGTGELRGSVMKWSFRRCPQCQGGRMVRRGAGVVGLPQARQQARDFRQAQKNTRFWQRW